MSKSKITCTEEEDCPCRFCEKCRRRPPTHPAQYRLIIALCDALDACRDLAAEPDDSLPEYVGYDSEGMIYCLEMFLCCMDSQTNCSRDPEASEAVKDRMDLLELRERERKATHENDEEDDEEESAALAEVAAAPPSPPVNSQPTTTPRKRNYWEPEPDVI